MRPRASGERNTAGCQQRKRRGRRRVGGLPGRLEAAHPVPSHHELGDDHVVLTLPNEPLVRTKLERTGDNGPAATCGREPPTDSECGAVGPVAANGDVTSETLLATCTCTPSTA